MKKIIFKILIALYATLFANSLLANDVADRLTRISQALRGGVNPSIELIDQANKDPKSIDFDKIVDGWLQGDEFYSNLRVWYQKLFRAPHLLKSDIEFLDNAPEGLRESLATEPVEFALWVVKNNMPYTALIESQLALRNAVLDSFYAGADPTGKDTANWYPVMRQENHAGVLTLKSMHYRNPTTIVNRWRTHANQVLQMWSCQVLEVNIDVAAAEDDETHGTDPACAGCHRPLDGIGTFFSRWDREGNFSNDSSIDDRGSYYETTAITHQANGLVGLGHLLANSKRFAQCMTEKSWEFLAGRDLAETETAIRSDLLQTFWQSNYDLKKLLKAIVLSPEFAKNQ